MKLSTKGRYGTRVLLDLSRHNWKEPVPLKDIARRQQISLQYLEHLISPLISAGLIRSVRGAKGGIILNRAPEKIRLGEAIQILEGSIAPVDCIANPDICPRSKTCATRDVWDDVKKAMDRVLESVTLKDLVERQKAKEQTAEAMYHI